MTTRLQMVSRVAATMVIAIGCLVITGWLFNITIFKSILPGLATMKFNTALAFVMAGIGLLVLRTQPRVTQIVAIVIIVLGLLTISEYLFGWNLGIDQWLIHETASPQNLYPGRISIISALSFVCVGIALLLIHTRRYWLAHVIILIPAFLSMLAIIGYVYNVETLYRLGSFSSTALHTAVTFVVLCISVIVVYPSNGLSKYVSANSAGGYILRRMIPAAILVPIIIGWLRWQGELQGLYDTAFGLALFTTSNIFVSAALVIWISRTLHATDVERKQGLEALYQAHDQLETRVQERTSELLMVNEAMQEQIVQRKRAEDQFRAVLESAPDAIITVNAQGEIILVNARTEQFFGYTRAEMLGKPIEILIPERFHRQHSVHRNGYSAAPNARNVNVGLDLYAQRKDGSQFPVEISLSPTETEEGILTISSIRDITERKRAEESLARLAAIVQSSDDAIIAKTLDGIVTSWNGGAERLFGYSAPEMIGQPIQKLFPADQQGEETQIMDRLLRGEHIEQFETERVTKDGHLIPVALTITLVKDSSGNIIGASKIARDISQRKAAENALRENEDKLQTMFKLLPVGVSVMDKDKHIIQMNLALEEIMGMSMPNLVLGKYRAWQYIDPDGKLLLPAEFPSERAFTEQQSISNVEMGIVKEDGTTIWTSVSAAPLPHNQGAVIVTTDITERKQTEQALHYSLEQFYNTFVYASIGMALVNLDGCWLQVNQAVCEIVGYSVQELLTKTFQDITHPDDLDSDINNVQQLLAGEIQSYQMEKRYLHKLGHEVWVLLSVSLVRDDQGEPQHFVSQLQDISKRKQAEQEVQRLLFVLDKMVEGVQIVSPDWRYIYINESAANQNNYTKAESLGNTMMEMFPGIDETPFFDLMRRCRDEGISDHMENHFTFPDKSMGWYDLRIQAIPDGVIILSTDISARKHADLVLQESERYLRLITQNSPDMMYIMDLIQRKATYLNRMEFLGYSQNEIEEFGSLLSALHPDDKAIVMAHWNEVMSDGDPNTVTMIEYRLQDKSGQWQWVQSRESIFKTTSEAKPTQILVTLSVITERKQAEQQALELIKEREQVKILSDFVKNTSHDFRTPLSIISSSLYLLSKSNDPEKQKRHFGIAEQQIVHLTHLLDRLQGMGRLDSVIALALQPLDVNSLVSDWCANLRFEAKEKAVTVLGSLWESSLMVQADFKELSLALSELGKNALGYTPLQGTITIRTSQEETEAVIEVRDTGSGISAAHLPHIFERLYRVDEARSLETGATGLGLSIAKRIIDLHQGRIVVESVVGEGSVFRVFLPLST
ncbi:MAG: PAS domain S-box protein [Anaerolineae bacterium]|nr:PAS domain S-box protein [Anaerolineae bacterium]